MPSCVFYLHEGEDKAISDAFDSLQKMNSEERFALIVQALRDYFDNDTADMLREIMTEIRALNERVGKLVEEQSPPADESVNVNLDKMVNRFMKPSTGLSK
jgi:hypothetical protein